MEALQLKSSRPSLCQTHMMERRSAALPDILWTKEKTPRQQRQKRLSVFHVRQSEFVVGSCQHIMIYGKSALCNKCNLCHSFSSDAPKYTSAFISPSGLVSAGSWVKLTCSSRAKPPVSSFTWFKKSRDGAVKVSEGEIYSFNVTDGGVYYCVATNDLGNQTSAEIHLTLTYCEGKSQSQQLFNFFFSSEFNL